MAAEGAENTGFAARCLLRAARAATLATMAEDGTPFASLVTPAIAADGSVLMLLSSLAAHTRHLQADPHCALMVMGQAENENPQTAPRFTVTGVAAPDTDPGLRRFWVAHHPYAALYADFTDFGVWRLMPAAGLFVGGFARAATLTAADFLPPAEAVSAVSQAEQRILGHCNADHADALNLLAHARGHGGDWRMLCVDIDGFDMVQDDSVLRIDFDAPVADAAGVRAALVRLVEAAR